MKFREADKCSVFSNWKPQKEQCNDNPAKSKKQLTCNKDLESFLFRFPGVLIFQDYFSSILKKIFIYIGIQFGFGRQITYSQYANKPRSQQF